MRLPGIAPLLLRSLMIYKIGLNEHPSKPLTAISLIYNNEKGKIQMFQSKFLAFYQYAKNFNSDCFNYEELKKTDFVFMRWKEHFLVPDHTIKDINGASFAGFYYICFQKSTSSIEGYYYHRNSEWFQSLNLTHVPDHSVQIYEFR